MSSSDATLIDDGYTRNVRINAVPRLHGQLDFVFRPASLSERSTYNREVRAKPPEKDYEPGVELIVRKIAKWSIGPDKPTKEQVMRMHPQLYSRVLDCVLGYVAPDEDLEESGAGNSGN